MGQHKDTNKLAFQTCIFRVMPYSKLMIHGNAKPEVLKYTTFTPLLQETYFAIVLKVGGEVYMCNYNE